MPKGWDPEKPDSKKPDFSEPIGKGTSSKTRNIIIGVVIAGGIIAGLFIAGYVQSNMDKASVSDKIIAGEYDAMLRQKCIERLNSYGLGPVPEGSINLCVDTAKGIAYSELNK